MTLLASSMHETLEGGKYVLYNLDDYVVYRSNLSYREVEYVSERHNVVNWNKGLTNIIIPACGVHIDMGHGKDILYIKSSDECYVWDSHTLWHIKGSIREVSTNRGGAIELRLVNGTRVGIIQLSEFNFQVYGDIERTSTNCITAEQFKRAILMGM